jgi:hypothetical protein
LTSEVIDAPRRRAEDASIATLPKETSMNASTLAPARFANAVAPGRMLVLALRTDAAVSGAVALLQLAAAGLIGSLTLLSVPLLFASGLFLVGYVGLLLLLAAARRVWRPLLWLVIGGNVLWALGAIVLAEAGAASLPGIAYLALHAVSTLFFAAWEAAGLRRSVAA